MSDSNQGKNPPYLQIALVVIPLIGVLVTALAPQIFRDPPEPLVQLTAQAIQTNVAVTAIVQQSTLAAQFTATPTQTESPTSIVVISTDTSTVTPTVTDTDTPTQIPPTLIFTVTLTQTATNTVQAIQISAPTNTIVQLPSPTMEPSLVPTIAPTEIVRMFPCTAVVVNIGGSTTVVDTYVEASTAAQRGRTTRIGDNITVQRRTIDANQISWFLIYRDVERLGWIQDRYLSLSETCPT